MQQWTDLFLNKPLPEGWMQGLLFITFGLHLLFVLLMLGTAILSLLFFLRDLLRQPTPDQHWNEHVAHSHMGLKSLAVVLGVGPLLLMQISHPHAFFTVTGLFSYAWLAIIPLLIAAFLLFDGFAHKLSTSAWLALICGLVGVAALMTVPAIFTGALTLMERPAEWADFAARGIRFDAQTVVHQPGLMFQIDQPTLVDIRILGVDDPILTHIFGVEFSNLSLGGHVAELVL